MSRFMSRIFANMIVLIKNRSSAAFNLRTRVTAGEINRHSPLGFHVSLLLVSGRPPFRFLTRLVTRYYALHT